jgi:hypothetical protein
MEVCPENVFVDSFKKKAKQRYIASNSNEIISIADARKYLTP